MVDKVLDGLMDIFNSVNFRFLPTEEVTQLLQSRGFYQNVKFSKACADVWDHLNRPTAAYPFCDIERNGETLWGLERWLPPKERRKIKRHDHAASPLHVGREIQHTISVAGSEIESGTFPLRGQNANSLIASMDEQQRKHSIVELYCYGSEKLTCAITHDDRGNWFLEGMALQRWYNENDLQPGDKIWLVVESINPLVLRTYTEWDRDADTYRRYEQRRKLETFPYADLPIRDLVWIYFKRNQTVAHRSEIARAVLVDRPEISERSIDVCLGAYPHLFARVGKGNWGLKEWGVEQVTMVVRPKGSDLETDLDENLPTAIVPLDYILVNIVAEDLVYKILQSSKNSLSVSQITEKISKYLGVDKSILVRTTFLNPSDSRLVRRHDGTFTLRENLEEVISELAAREWEQRQSLNRINEEINDLKDEISSMMSKYETRFKKLEDERDDALNLAQEWFEQHEQIAKKWSIRSRLLSEFLAEIIPYIGYPNLQLVFDRLRRKPEPPRTEEEFK